MKVYVVMEYAVIEYEECTRVMGVFSSVDTAAEAVVEYEKEAADSCWHYEYFYEEYELDSLREASCWIADDSCWIADEDEECGDDA